MNFYKPILAAVLFLMVLIGIYFLRPAKPVAVVLPSPNGYDDFIAAGKKLEGVDLRRLSEIELRQFVRTNSATLRAGRNGLEKESRVPIKFVADSDFTGLSVVKYLGLGLEAEGRVAEWDGQTNRACLEYFDVVRLGVAGAKGGLLIHKLVGIASESIGITALRKASRGLDAVEARELILKLQQLEAQEESIDTILDREEEWSRVTSRFRERLANIIANRSLRPIRKMMGSHLTKRVDTLTRGKADLLLQLAARAYELEHGAQPKNWSDLVPAYLKTIPLDPLTGNKLIFRFD